MMALRFAKEQQESEMVGQPAKEQVWFVRMCANVYGIEATQCVRLNSSDLCTFPSVKPVIY